MNSEIPWWMTVPLLIVAVLVGGYFLEEAFCLLHMSKRPVDEDEEAEK